MSNYVLHWPAFGIENGEYVGAGEELMQNPTARHILFAAGFLAALLTPILLIGTGILGTQILTQTAGLEAFGGSALAAIVVIAALVAVADILITRIGFSPVNNIAGVIAVSVVLPVAVVYVWIRHRSTRIDNPEALASLAGESGWLRVVAASMFKRRPKGPFADGGIEDR